MENFFFCAMDLQLPKIKYHLQITFDMIKDFWINGQYKWKMKEVLKSNLIELSNRFKSLQWAWAILNNTLPLIIELFKKF